MSRATGMMTLVALLGGWLAAGCGGESHHKMASRNHCRATVGFEGPTGTALGRQQLAFARLAVADDNPRNRTRITLLAADTRLDPASALAATNQFVSRPRLVAVVGPAEDEAVEAAGSVFARAGVAFISGSATGAALTEGANPTFFRVVPSDISQGPQEARFVARSLRPRSVVIVEDRDAYSRQLTGGMLPILRSAGIPVEQLSVSQASVDFGTAAARVRTKTGVVILAWRSPSAAERFAKALLAQHKPATIVGPDGLYAPGIFTTPGAYVSFAAPDITSLPSDAQLVTQAKRSVGSFGTLAPATYAATHVIDQAIAAVCRAGQPPSRSGVLAAVSATADPSSILGIPIRFHPDGELVDARWSLFRINPGGRYRMLSTK